MSQQQHPDSRLNATALLSLLVGIFGTLCFFWGIAGIGSIVLGMVGHSEIKRSEGRQHGTGLAIAGIALGVLHIVALVIGMAVLFTLAASKSATAAFPGATPPTLAPTPPPSVAPGAPAAKAADEPGAASRESGTRTTRFGGLTLIDPGTDEPSLATLLESELAEATDANEKLVLFLTTPDCAPCTGVSIALASKRMQSALDGVRLLRIDARDYQIELARRGFPIDVMPGFALVGSRGEPSDYVNGGEWDADIPENIAPVLGSFVRGTYRQRRNSWRTQPRGDETAL
jgi:hypothetical protein